MDISAKPLLFGLSAFFLSFLTGCDEWPPLKSEAIRHFHEKRPFIEQLEDKLANSKYYEVHLGGLGLSFGRIYAEGLVSQERLDDDSGWHELLLEAEIFGIEKYDDAYAIRFGSDPFDGNTLGSLAYIHDPDAYRELKACQPEFEALGCGLCVVHLEDDWWIRYEWIADSFTDESYESLLDGEISEEDYRAANDEATNKCIAEGYAAIGYDVDK